MCWKLRNEKIAEDVLKHPTPILLMWLVDLNYIFECDWLIKLSDNKLSNNNLASEFVKNRSFFKQTTIEKIEILVIKNVTTFNSFKNEKMS